MKYYDVSGRKMTERRNTPIKSKLSIKNQKLRKTGAKKNSLQNEKVKKEIHAIS
jgi:hypothetical protein